MESLWKVYGKFDVLVQSLSEPRSPNTSPQDQLSLQDGKHAAALVVVSL